ncbi:hypothetical protein BLS_006236 [Venturia inaequalis]|uniref:nitrilase n=1 Tax=Venturia inaequalis TaxID=5025 RepID=A0A8H3UCY3_VENIN|nr:hypothetical protein BLS_006236 [Venturia inaequalis]
MRFLIPFSLVAAVSAVPANISTVDYNNLTVALVRAAPVNWPAPILNKNWTGVSLNLTATVSYAVDLIDTAAAKGANLVVFPETWFPGYPKGNDDAWIASHIHDYVANSLEIGSPEWESLLVAAEKNKVYLALGFSERTNASIFMAQALIGPDGATIHHRRKVRPSGGERDIWSDGDMSGLKVLNVPYGRWGMLECWEHYHPTMTFPMQAQLETLHIAAFPYQPPFNDPLALSFENADNNIAAARVYAINSGAVTLFTSIGYATILSSSGTTLAEISADVPYATEPVLYYSINTTDKGVRAGFDVDGEQSWGVLREIEEGWPGGVPRVRGAYVGKKTVMVRDLYAFAEGYGGSMGNGTVGVA